MGFNLDILSMHEQMGLVLPDGELEGEIIPKSIAEIKKILQQHGIKVKAVYGPEEKIDLRLGNYLIVTPEGTVQANLPLDIKAREESSLPKKPVGYRDSDSRSHYVSIRHS